MQYRLTTKQPSLICLILLISFASVATVLISPALPAMTGFFEVSAGYMQQLITIFVIGYAVGQLIYSPLANRFGRKTAIYLGISLYLLSCLLCLLGIYIHSLEAVIIGRLFMALGSSVGLTMSFTIINDFYYPEQARKIVSYTMLSFAFMPAVAVAIGGFLTSRFSWIDNFYFYFCYGILMLFIASRLPETLTDKKLDALKIKPMLGSFYCALTNGRLMLFSIIYGLVSSFIYVIASGGPFIGVEHIGLTPEQYGLYLLGPYCGQFLGALFAGKLSVRLSPYQMLAFGYSLVIIGSVMLFINFLNDWITVVSFMLPIFLIMIGLPMTYSIVTVKALMGHDDKATGSSIMSFITMSICLLATFILSLLPAKNPITMPTLFIAILVLAVAAFCYAYYRFSDKPKPAELFS